MNVNPLRAFAAALAAAVALAACGGSDDGPAQTNSTSSTSTPNNTAPTAVSYAAALSQLNTPEGLTGSAVAEAFDSAYLDAGMTKPQVLDALAGEASALRADTTHSLFPQVALENVTLSGCDASNVCTLTGTLRNSDADDTSVQVTTKVVSTGNGGYRLLGDQLAS